MIKNVKMYACFSVFAMILIISFFCGDPIQPDFNIPPEIANDSIYISGGPNQDSAFTMYIVLSKGIKPLLYSWFKNSAPLPGGTDSLLYFNGLALPDNGNYRCIVQNDYGIDTSKTYFLSVIPSITDSIKPSINLISPEDGDTVTTVSLPIYYP